MSFAQIKNKTEYSILSVGSMKDFIKNAAEKDIGILGICDDNSVGGAYTFNKECLSAGIKPVIGITVKECLNRWARKNSSEKEREIFDLNIFARNIKGLQTIYKIKRAASKSFYYVPRTDLNDISSHDTSNLIFVTGLPETRLGSLIFSGQIEQADLLIKKYKSLNFKLVFEVSPHFYAGTSQCNIFIKEFSKKYKIPVIFSNNTRFKHKEDFSALKAVESQNKTFGFAVQAPFYSRDMFLSQENYIKELFIENHSFSEKYVEKIIKNSYLFAEKYIDSYDFDTSGKLPEFTENHKKSRSLLIKEVKEGLKSKNLWNSEYKKRAKYELDIINKKGFADYFLIVSDLIRWAKSSNIIVGPSRGSAGGSLVSYAIDIIEIDPVQNGLLFERFLDETRADYPDIDIDFEKFQRDKVDEYLKKKYGSERVIPIGTNLKFGPSNALKTIAKAFGYEEQEINEITRTIRPTESIEEAYSHSSVREFLNENKKIEEYARKINGQIFAFGQHASGIIVSSRDVIEDSPINTRKGVEASCYVDGKEERELSELGIVKIDRLGLKNLDVAKRCIEYIEQNHDEIVDFSNIKQDDKGVFEVFKRGYTTVIFQFNENKTKGILRKVKPESVDDLSAITAANRPGPIEAGLVDKLILNKNIPKEEWEKYHPIVDKILEPTYGVLLYQEQVMEIAKKLALFTPVQSNHLRKIIKKSSGSTSTDKERDKLKESFIQGCQKNGISPKIADHVYEMCAAFANYSFNKSHSWAYSWLAYKQAWLLAYYPTEFMASYLAFQNTSTPKDKRRFTQIVNECHNIGVWFKVPDINTGTEKMKIEKDFIMMGFENIKGLGKVGVQKILNARPFNSIEDFFFKIKSFRGISLKTIESMVAIGCFDSIIPDGKNRSTIVKNLKNHKDNLRLKNKRKIVKSNRIIKKQEISEYLKKCFNIGFKYFKWETDKNKKLSNKSAEQILEGFKKL